MIVVHGGPGTDHRYLLPLQTLSDEYYVVSYDQRGTGLSPRVDAAELTLENSIEDLDRVVEHYGGGEPVAIVGHSWGAMLASAYIRAREFTAHGDWMVRNFALTFAAVTLRLWLPLLTTLFGATTGYEIVAWLCWIPNLVVAEAIVQTRLRREVPGTLAQGATDAAEVQA